jgi:hypothetical protein
MAIIRWVVAFLWVGALVVLMFLTAGCGAAGVGASEPVVIEVDGDAEHDVDEPEVLSAEWRQRDDFEAFREPLRFTPDAGLEDAFVLAARKYMARLGLEIEIAAGGIPATVQDEVRMGDGRLVDARARSNKPSCAFDECNDPARGAAIYMSSALLTTKAWVLQQTVEHEIGHVVGGWAPHLPNNAKHLMSPGCINHVCGPWTVEDAGMFCAGAPCTKMDLTAAP